MTSTNLTKAVAADKQLKKRYAVQELHGLLNKHQMCLLKPVGYESHWKRKCAVEEMQLMDPNMM